MIKLTKPESNTWVNPRFDLGEALRGTTHLAIGAHQDDLEFMAYEGIAACYEREDRWFAGVTVTDGRGSARTGPYSDHTDEEMRLTRRREQIRAAEMGQYAAQFQLDYSSEEVKTTSQGLVVRDLVAILSAMRPQIVYLHQPADKHDTHVAVLSCCLKALRQTANRHTPDKVIGCEGWRGLDWLADSDKVAMDCGSHPDLAKGLMAVFDSQISGGKRYDRAVTGRRHANATHFDSHNADQFESIAWGIDLTELVANGDLSIKDFILNHIRMLAADVGQRLDRYT